jgi:NTE family protein
MAEPAKTIHAENHYNRARFGIALGGGGARGLAHILMLEVLDAANVQPSVVAGTSIGAIIGAAYCAGMSGLEIRAYCEKLFANHSRMLRHMLDTKVGKLSKIWTLEHPVSLNAEILLQRLLPAQLNCQFDQLRIPLKVMAADFYMQSEYVIDSGDVLPAVAASAALPGLLAPVRHKNRVLIDGGFVNPLPVSLLHGHCTHTIAIDVSVAPQREKSGMPNAFDTVIGSQQITINTILSEKLRRDPPDILIRANVGDYGVLDFFMIGKILDEARSSAEALKRALDASLSRAGV